MKLFRFVTHEDPRPRVGLMTAEGVAHALADVPDLTGAALASGTFVDALRHLGEVLRDPVRMLAPIADPRNIVGVAGNYGPPPDPRSLFASSQPELFSKSVSALCGPNETITTPHRYAMLDIEAELGVVVGREAWQVAERDAHAYVFGYTIVNDVSDRGLQGRGDAWFRAKNGDKFCPLGPFVVPAEHVPLAEGLRIRSFVNGVPFQDGNTAQMRHGVTYLLSYVSRYCRLHPGDIIATGAPEGYGMTRTPPYFLRDGDEVEITITGLGTQRQRVILA